MPRTIADVCRELVREQVERRVALNKCNTPAVEYHSQRCLVLVDEIKELRKQRDVFVQSRLHPFVAQHI